jgi:hypothetical protein
LLGTSPSFRARGIKPLKCLQKAALKAPNQILHKICGFTYTHIQKAVLFGYRKPVLSDIFFPLGGFFAAFLAARDHDKFIPLALAARSSNAHYY